MTNIESRSRKLRRIANKVSGRRLLPMNVPQSEDPLPNTNPNDHYQISKRGMKPVNLAVWLSSNTDVPCLQVGLPFTLSFCLVSPGLGLYNPIERPHTLPSRRLHRYSLHRGRSTQAPHLQQYNTSSPNDANQLHHLR